MPIVRAFTQTYQGKQINLLTDVKVSHADKELTIVAKWDTGAEHTCICPRVAALLNLQPSGVTRIITSTSEAVTNNYIITLTLPQNNMILPDIEVWSMVLDKPDYDLLIGMDIINQGDFCVSNFNGNTTLTFRIPSIVKTDYVIELRTALDKQQNMGSNEQ